MVTPRPRKIKDGRRTDGFTADRLDWLEVVSLDGRLTPLQKCVGVRLALGYVNGAIFAATGELRAWPAQTTLAKELGASPEAIAKAAKALERCGHLRREVGLGRGRHTTYTLVQPTPKTRTEDRELAEIPRTEDQVFDQKTRTGEGGKPEPTFGKTRTKQGTNPLKNPLNKNPGIERDAREIPSSWAPHANSFVFGEKLGFTREEVELAAAKFLRHYTSKGSMSFEWDAEFESWLIGNAQRKAEGQSRPAQGRLTGREWAIRRAAE